MCDGQGIHNDMTRPPMYEKTFVIKMITEFSRSCILVDITSFKIGGYEVICVINIYFISHKHILCYNKLLLGLLIRI